MSKRTTKKRQNIIKERKKDGRISKKLVGLFILVVLALVGLALRITYINASDHQDYKRQVLNQTQQQYSSRVIPFKRGEIQDRNGTILAASEKVYNVILDCKIVNSKVKVKDKSAKIYLEPTVKALVEVLGLDEDDIRSRLEDDKTKNSQYQILKKQLSITDKKKFEDYLDLDNEENKSLSDKEKLMRQRVKGVWFEETYVRRYPMNSMASDLIGFTYDGITADWGIEGYYSSLLNGVNGRQFGYFNSDADVEQTIQDPINGKNVISTIDANIQQIIRDALESYENEMANGPNGTAAAKNVGVIAMNPNTGEILGMDSSDWYDLNNPRDLKPFYSAEEIAAMDDKAQLDALNKIWRNFCISDTFEPGSTVKPMTVAAALESGSISADDTYHCNGFKTVSGLKIKCAIYPNGHGTLSLGDSLKHSCNVAMMDIAEKMGAENFLRYQKIFNFGDYTGIDLPGEGSGILHTQQALGSTELATAAFGQGFTGTMIQEIAAFSSVINGGTYYKPQVVSSVTDSLGAVVENIDPVMVRKTISPEVSNEVRQYLGTVMDSDGSGAKAKVAGYSMGGKTGTAQKIPRTDKKYLVSFIGFAPLDHPQVALYVVVDEPNAAIQANSIYPQQIYKKIMKELLPYLNIFPADPSAVELPDKDSTTNKADGVVDENVPKPPEGETSAGNNNMLSGGVTNSDAEITNE